MGISEQADINQLSQNGMINRGVADDRSGILLLKNET